MSGGGLGLMIPNKEDKIFPSTPLVEHQIWAPFARDDNNNTVVHLTTMDRIVRRVPAPRKRTIAWMVELLWGRVERAGNRGMGPCSSIPCHCSRSGSVLVFAVVVGESTEG